MRRIDLTFFGSILQGAHGHAPGDQEGTSDPEFLPFEGHGGGTWVVRGGGVDVVVTVVPVLPPDPWADVVVIDEVHEHELVEVVAEGDLEGFRILVRKGCERIDRATPEGVAVYHRAEEGGPFRFVRLEP